MDSERLNGLTKLLKILVIQLLVVGLVHPTQKQVQCGELLGIPFSLEYTYNYYFDYDYFVETYDSVARSRLSDTLLVFDTIIRNSGKDTTIQLKYDRPLPHLNWSVESHPSLRFHNDTLLYWGWIDYYGCNENLESAGVTIYNKSKLNKGRMRVQFPLSILPYLVNSKESISFIIPYPRPGIQWAPENEVKIEKE